MNDREFHLGRLLDWSSDSIKNLDVAYYAMEARGKAETHRLKRQINAETWWVSPRLYPPSFALCISKWAGHCDGSE